MMTVTSRISQHHITSLVKTANLKRIPCTDRERNFTVWQRYKDTVKISTEQTNCKRVMVLLCIAYCGRNIWTLQHAEDEEDYFKRAAPQVSSDVLIAAVTCMKIFSNGTPCKSLDRYQYYENAVSCIICHEHKTKWINKSRHLKLYK